MARHVRWYLVGSLVLLTLVGCARNFLAQREPWRREAEIQCLKAGSVKQGSTVALLSPIDGPGICGADFPLKVSALGDDSTLGYMDEPVRPPATIGGASGRTPSGQVLGAPPDILRVPNRSMSSAPPVGESGSSDDEYAAPAPRSDPNRGRTPRRQEAVTRGSLPPLSDRTSARQSAPLDLAEPGFSPTPIDRTSPYRDSPRPGSAAIRTAPAVEPPATASAYPPSYPPMGERVPLASPAEPAAASAVAVSPAATLSCPLVSALDRWIAESVQPAAQRWFGQPVVAIRQISAYSCRGMNGNPHAHISEHAFGNALDVAAFTLADGHVITVKQGWHGTAEEQAFLHDVQGAACETFTTVLAPGSNVYHYDHIHVDLMRRSSGRHICQPGAVPGEVVAARVRGSYAGRRPSDSGYTGSIAARRQSGSRHADAPNGDDRKLPRAVPGED